MSVRPLPEIPTFTRTPAAELPEENRFTITDYVGEDDISESSYDRRASQNVEETVSNRVEPELWTGDDHAESSTSAQHSHDNGREGHLFERQPSLPLTTAGLKLHQSQLRYQPPSTSDTPRESHLTPRPSLPMSMSSNHSHHSTDLEAMTQEGKVWSDVVEEEEAGPGFDDHKSKPIPPPLKSAILSPVTRKRSWRRLMPSSIPCRLLLLTVLLETCIDLAIEGNMLWRFNLEVQSSDSTELEIENKRRLPVYLCIFGLAHLFQLVLTVDAIRTRNTIQVVGLAIFNGMFLIYAGIQISEIRTILGDNTSSTSGSGPSLLTLPLNALTAVIISVIAVCEVAVIILTWFIWREFGWKIYRSLGADINIKRYYFQYQVFECICRFSAFFFAGFGIQFIFLVLEKSDPEFVATCVAFPVSLIILALGVFGAKHENKYLMSSFLLGLALASAYFVYKLVRIWQDRPTYKNISTSLTVFSALSLTCLVLCAGWGIVIWRNFHKGLKEHLVKPRTSEQVSSQQSSPVAEYPMQSTGTALAQKRLTID